MTTCTASRHGTAAAFAKVGCRCPAAIRDKKWQDYERSQGRPMTVDAAGTIRRIRALQAMGWTGRQIMAAAGWDGANLGAQIYQQARVHRTTAERFAAVYDRLADVAGPSKYTRTYARNRGWLPPLWWDDDTIDDPTFTPRLVDATRGRDDVDPVVVDRLVAGAPFPGHATRAERVAAYRRLISGGWSYVEVQHRLHVSGDVMRELAADAGGIAEAAA